MLNRIKTLPWRVIIPWLLCVVATAAAAVFFLRYDDLKQEDSRRDEVATVSRLFVDALTNFSYETIEEDAAEIRGFAVGDFAEEAETFLGDQGIEAIKQAQATSEGTIVSLFIQAVDDDEASAFAVVEETISNSASAEPQSDTLRLEVGMIETSDGWKVQRVEIFQAPGTGLIGGPAAG